MPFFSNWTDHVPFSAGSVLEQSLCLFGWVGGVKDKGFISLNHYLAVFDINQWYQVKICTCLCNACDIFYDTYKEGLLCEMLLFSHALTQIK